MRKLDRLNASIVIYINLYIKNKNFIFTLTINLATYSKDNKVTGKE